MNKQTNFAKSWFFLKTLFWTRRMQLYQTCHRTFIKVLDSFPYKLRKQYLTHETNKKNSFGLKSSTQHVIFIHDIFVSNSLQKSESLSVQIPRFIKLFTFSRKKICLTWKHSSGHVGYFFGNFVELFIVLKTLLSIFENSKEKHTSCEEKIFHYNTQIDTFNSVLTTFLIFLRNFRILSDPKSNDEKSLFTENNCFPGIVSLNN